MDAKCDSGTPYCYSGGCVRCTADTQCSGATPSCNPTSHTCVCRIPSAGNRLTNPGFDGGLTGWTVYEATTSADSEACPASSSAYQVSNEEDPNQCFALTPGSYFLGGKFNNGSGSDFIRITFRSGANCQDSSSVTIDPTKTTFDFHLPTPLNSWTSASTPFTAPANTVSAQVGVFGIQLYVDQLYVNTSNHF
jgi:hypothetical protein